MNKINQIERAKSKEKVKLIQINKINYQNNTKNLKTYFIILNLILSVIAFSFLVDAEKESCPNGNCPNEGSAPSSTPTPSGGAGGASADEPDVDTGVADKGTDPSVDEGPSDIGGGDLDVDRGGGGGKGGFFDSFSNFNLQSMVMKAGLGAAIFGSIGAVAGGENGAQWGALAGAIGGIASALTEESFGTTGSLIFGLAVATAIFIFTYKKVSTEITEFMCLPWQAPIGGGDCELCNEFEECSEYTCKSLGQACAIINKGTSEQKCVWQNPHDVNSPIIEFKEVNKDHVFKPDRSVRPPARGVTIKPKDNECIKAFFPLEFKFVTDEPAQCKIDYNLTKGYEEMAFYVSGNSLLDYNHTEKLSLPGPDALNAANPELKNDGKYNLFIRCRDANGNFNQDPYSVSFCVEKGPDTTPPIIVNVNIPSGNPVQYNKTSFNLEVYINEPSECKWSREDRNYDNMEESMSCDTQVWQMNNLNTYTCRAVLTGIQDRKENKYYFRCKDKPGFAEGDRNVNTQSYVYTLIGTQPLNILEVSPNLTIKGSTEVVPVFLKIKTDNGYQNGESLCYYYNDNENKQPLREEDYVLFHETKSNEHVQRQDLVARNYTYYFKCVDLGGNAEYKSTKFKVETDRASPKVVRVYREVDLKVITDEDSQCTYSNENCNFEIESGIEMTSFDNFIHTAEWVLNKNYYIRCKDIYDNQPFPNVCSIIVRPSQTSGQSEISVQY